MPVLDQRTRYQRTMKFMRLGTRPDTFYTEQATRTLISDVPSDLAVQVNDITYFLHKFLQMSESVEKGNLGGKLEAFFDSCILEGWKDSIVTLQATSKLPEWAENLGVVRKCIDSIIEKVLTPPPQVRWSFTYTRPGYAKKQHHSVPKDWWTEDVSDLDIDLFRCIIMALRATYLLLPQLIGEALHVYACRWLPGIMKPRTSSSSGSQTEESKAKNRKILETIVTMIPADKGAVSVGFLLRLLQISDHFGVSHVTKTELIRRASLQFDEATVNDLPCASASSMELVLAVLESYLKLWKRMSPNPADNSHFLRSIVHVGKLIDSYLQVVARDDNLPVSKFVALAEALPDIARLQHDDLYQAINIYLKAHAELGKADKKRLCRILDCEKLSAEARAHAVKNELLPLRTVVQLLYFEQEKKSSPSHQHHHHQLHNNHAATSSHSNSTATYKVLKSPHELSGSEAKHRPRSSNIVAEGNKDRLALEFERKMIVRGGEVEEVGSDMGRGFCRLGLDPRKIMRRARSDSDYANKKGR
ncbi:BTB/POZ domain-containing protein At5g47800 isoform X2 [Neltuma alba]|uniref:BTB/POZ domain-containing protein At5g47800 isoform X2 n=1 Tax=Neltuma alba TaxID=207710 RepID=UPI0010A51916|nr:BTB/POZ domain-containing protein At5g47800-like isoform X2 [Prosopis alba]